MSWCVGVLLCSCWFWTRDAGAQVKLDALPGPSGVDVRGQAGGQTGGVPALVRPSRALAQDIRASKEPLISDAFAVNDARGEFLMQMRRGELTPEAAWDKGWLTKENVLKIAGLWRDWSKEGKTLRVHLVGLLAEKSPEVLSPDALLPQNDGSGPIVLSSEDAGEAGTGAKQAVGLEAWSEWKRIVGEYYRQQRDARAVVWYEAALKDWQQARTEKAQARKLLVGGLSGTSGQVSRDKHGTIKQDGDPTWVNGVGGLAFYYAETGQPQKAAVTWMRAKDYSRNPQWLADAGIEAGRAYSQAGNEKGAQEVYAQVPQYRQGWYTGLAYYDQARRLIGLGQHAEARRLLQQPVDGPSADEARVALLSSLAYSFYRTQEYDQASQYSRQAIAQYISIPNPSHAEDLKTESSRAYEVLSYIKQWEKQAIVCWPREVRLSVAEKQGSEQQINIRTFPQVPLVVKSSDPRLKVKLANEWKEESFGFYFDKQMSVVIAPEAEGQAFNATVTVSSPRFAGFEDRVDVRVGAQDAAN